MYPKWRTTSKLFFLSSMAVALTATIGCKKDKDETPPPPAATGKVALLNAAFGTDSINLFVDAKKSNTQLIGYGDSLNYLSTGVGDREFDIKKKDNASIVKKTFKTEKDKNYSLLVTNAPEGDNFELLQVTDDLTAPATDKAKIRFIHLSPDADKLNLMSGDTKLAENISYKTASVYKEVEAKKTSFTIVDPQANKTLLSLTDFDLVKGKIYTIWASGLEETADNSKKIQAHLFINK